MPTHVGLTLKARGRPHDCRTALRSPGTCAVNLHRAVTRLLLPFEPRNSRQYRNPETTAPSNPQSPRRVSQARCRGLQPQANDTARQAHCLVTVSNAALYCFGSSHWVLHWLVPARPPALGLAPPRPSVFVFKSAKHALASDLSDLAYADLAHAEPHCAALANALANAVASIPWPVGDAPLLHSTCACILARCARGNVCYHTRTQTQCNIMCVCVCARTRVPPVTNKETNTYTKKQTHMAAHACMRTECSGFECSGFGTHEDLDSRCLSPCEARTGPNRCLVYLQHFADPRASPRHPCFPANTNSSDMSNTGNNSDMSSSSYNSRPQLRTLAATTANLSLGPS